MNAIMSLYRFIRVLGGFVMKTKKIYTDFYSPKNKVVPQKHIEFPKIKIESV
jgi:hypothetical protein